MWSIARLAVLTLGLLFVMSESEALELITAKEAALPDAVNPVLDVTLDRRAVTRAPKVVVVSPAPDAGIVYSPLDFVLRFEPHGGATVAPEFVKVIYLKRPNVNLTQRVQHLIAANGIDLYDAEVPPGTHHIRVEITDDAGRKGSASFALMVGN
jgi:hypothetical protein